MPDKRKIQFVIWTENPGGIEKILMYYPTNLSEFKYSIYVLRPRPPKNVGLFTESLFDEKKYGSLNNRKLYRYFYNYTRKNRNSVFHVFNAGPAILFILKLAGCRHIIYHIHGTVYWKKPHLKSPTKLLWKMALSKRIKIIANSGFSRKVFQDKISAKYPVEVIYNPFPTDKYSSGNKEINKRDLSVFYVGRLVDGKNLFLWIDIAKKINEYDDKITFHFYGKGKLEDELKAYVDQLGLKQNFNFHGYVEKIEEVYSKHDLLLFLSEYESFGNVVVESILSGTPVVAKPIPSIKEIFNDFPEFLLNEGNDYAEQVIQRLKRLEQLEQLSIKAKEDFANRFSMENHMKLFKTLYEQS